MTDGRARPNPFREDASGCGEESGAASVITLLTDFGPDEHYAGVMKGVILATNPSARVVDITHAIRPYDVRGGSLILGAAAHNFPRGTVHAAVVDPGVGSGRRGIIAATQNYYFVGPDNGLLSCALDDPLYAWTRELREDAFFLDEVSSTFHGRDVFAPAAAHLAGGTPPEEFGPLVADPVRLDFPRARFEEAEEAIVGEVIYVDRYGNLITNIDTTAFWRFEDAEDGAARLPVIEIGGRVINGVSECYQAVEAGGLGAQFNSWTRLEIFVPEGSAAGAMGAGVGEEVRVRMARVSI